MATSDIEKVLTVFRAIASRDAELTTKYMNPGKYTQTQENIHNTILARPMVFKG
jgi:hypothetical protein